MLACCGHGIHAKKWSHERNKSRPDMSNEESLTVIPKSTRKQMIAHFYINSLAKTKEPNKRAKRKKSNDELFRAFGFPSPPQRLRLRKSFGGRARARDLEACSRFLSRHSQRLVTNPSFFYFHQCLYGHLIWFWLSNLPFGVTFPWALCFFGWCLKIWHLLELGCSCISF